MINKKPKILLAEDDANFGAVLRDYLCINDYDVKLCKDGSEALGAFLNNSFDLCILDVMMPVKDGFMLAREIREKNKTMPIVFLTAKTLKNDMLEGFKIGADDYITKPFDSEILLYKIKAVLNRNKEIPQENLPNDFKIGKYDFNYKLRTVSDGKQKHNLSPKEGELLFMLCLKMNDLLKRQDALKKIWGDDNYFTGRSMDVFIAKLRKYLSGDPNVELLNIHGSGFRLIVK
ncbi:MAG: response regulator transcription factor [Bacteroidia bacterium]